MPVYASCDGQAYFQRDEHGGERIYIRTGLLSYNSQPAHFNIIHWHLCGDTDPQYPSQPTSSITHRSIRTS